MCLTMSSIDRKACTINVNACMQYEKFKFHFIKAKKILLKVNITDSLSLSNCNISSDLNLLMIF